MIAVVAWLMAGQECVLRAVHRRGGIGDLLPLRAGPGDAGGHHGGHRQGRELGILFKSAEALERAHDVRAAVLDKTGTLTEGKPAVKHILTAGGVGEAELIRLAASAERNSRHPLAAAVLERAAQGGIDGAEVEGFEERPGRGIMARLDDKALLAGNEKLLTEAGVDISPLRDGAVALAEGGETLIWIAYDGALAGVIGLSDQIKPTSRQAVKALNDMGIETVMLTGDNRRAAQAVAGALGVRRVEAEVLPGDKARAVQDIQKEGKRCAMIGDGINDAPALTVADVGIAIGAGSDIAIESAGVVLMKGDLMDAANAIRLSRAVIKNIKENLFWAFFYNALGIPLAAGVFYPLLGWTLSPMFAAAAMSLSSLCVVLNALRLTRFKPIAAPDTRDDTSAHSGAPQTAGAPAHSGAPQTVGAPAQRGGEASPRSGDQPETARREAPDASDETPKEEETMKRTVHIEGMSCGHCAAHVERALRAIGMDAHVDLEKKQAAATGMASNEAIEKAVADAGYRVTAID